MAGPESKQPNLDSKTIIIIQSHHPSRDRKQLSITKIRKASCSKNQSLDTITFYSHASHWLVIDFSGGVVFPCAHLGTHASSVLWSYPLYVLGIPPNQPAHEKKKKRDGS